MMNDPIRNAEAVTPHDTNVTVTGITRGLYIGGTGTLSVVLAGGATVSFAAVPVGILPLQVTRVRATGTSATNIVALY